MFDVKMVLKVQAHEFAESDEQPNTTTSQKLDSKEESTS